MSLFDKDCGCNEGVSGARENKCGGCVCDQLRRLSPNTEIEDILINGKSIDKDDIFLITFDRKTCCATFIAKDNNDTVTFTLDCRKIDAIFIELEN
jgi:hypothetical protein